MAVNPLVHDYLKSIQFGQTPPARLAPERIQQGYRPPIVQKALGALRNAKPSGAPASLGLGGQLSKGAVQDIVFKLAREKFGYDEANLRALDKLIQKESSWNPNADNPTSTAAGLFQKLQSMHGPVEKSVYDQAMWGLNYIKNRPNYGNAIKALQFHLANNYY